METIAGFDYFPLTFDASGALEARLIRRWLYASTTPGDHVICIAHGFATRARPQTSTPTYAPFRANLNVLPPGCWPPPVRRRRVMAVQEVQRSRWRATDRSGLDYEATARQRVAHQLRYLRDHDATPDAARDRSRPSCWPSLR